MNTTTKHYLSRAKERTGVKNRRTSERIAELALLRGKRSEDFNSREQKYLFSRDARGFVAVAYNGSCFIFSRENCCITTYELPKWFGKRPHYAGKEVIRDYRKYCKYNNAFEESAMVI